MSNQAVEVEILGKLTRVNCPEGQEESLRNAAQQLDERLKEMTSKTKITNEVQLLTFVALNVCHELESRDTLEAEQKKALTNKLEQLTASLSDALSQVTLKQQ
ncbi:cell division protein ZapA [Vibrio zhanjiangensis]|uniref:Cell division protein ZapA n=1 Tax=Vibrio zhanjiangensis TaxID=1046128 RepID=A0ABQ6EZZ0_9VIBR|nr:cell division protein ZapA [Vibrio zhanjiangensis]GLT18196.1 cell division protein ZapA [Vibrio zhanjiangensis]